MSLGTVMLGSVVSETVTPKLALPVLPCVSVALQVTEVVPSAKVDPDDGVQVTSTEPSTLSLAEAEKVTVAPLGPVASALAEPGTLTLGAVVSWTITSKLTCPVSPSPLVAVQVTDDVPIEKVLPEPGTQETGLPSVAVGSVQEAVAPLDPVASTVIGPGTSWNSGGSAAADCANRTSPSTATIPATSLALRAFALIQSLSPVPRSREGRSSTAMSRWGFSLGW
jgi:hypothetical protein